MIYLIILGIIVALLGAALLALSWLINATGGPDPECEHYDFDDQDNAP